MPSITGFIAPSAAAHGNRLLAGMVDLMRHEAFYRTGVMRNEAAHVAAGWAAHAGTFSDRNPIWNEAMTVCVLFAGEDFSDRAGCLQSSGSSDGRRRENAKYLVDAYEKYGERFIESLNGSFSGIVVDARNEQAILFNDRFGLGRVYVHDGDDGFYFSSEAKSILYAVESTRQLDVTGLAEYVNCGCALQGRTLFKNISLLPPASRWKFVKGKLISKETYFHVEEWEQQRALTEDEYFEQLRESFPGIVRRYFQGKSGIAMSLTGGLDGRMIMACSGHQKDELPCYTFGGLYRDCADVSLARQVAEDCGQSHSVISVDERFLGSFGPLAEKSIFVSDGAMDVTGSVELFANAQARCIAPVRMTGNYGSEILRCNVAFKASDEISDLFSPDFVSAARRAAATYHEEASVRPLSLIATKQVPWHHHSRLAVEQSQVTMRSPYLDNDLVKLAYQAPVGQEYSKLPALRFVHQKSPKLGAIPTDRGLLYRPRPALTRLQNLFQEAMFRAEYAYDYGMPHWLARIDSRLKNWRPERLFLGRHKFYHFRIWYRDQLAGYLQDVLLDPKSLTRSHISPVRLKAILNEHKAGHRNHTNALHQALSIELIYRGLLERKW